MTPRFLRRLLVVLLLAGAPAGARPAHAAGALRPAAAGDLPVPAVPYGAALPRFALFGWVSPPVESTTVERYGELAAAGFNVVLFAQGERGTAADNYQRLDCSRPFGLGNILLDNDLDSVYVSRPETWSKAEEIVARYRDDPSFTGYYLGDEPYPDAFPRLAEWFRLLRQLDPAHPAWVSLRPRGGFASRQDFQAYLEDFYDATQPAVLCNNQYDFLVGPRDLGHLPENVAVMGEVARAHGIRFWGVVQLIEHWRFRLVTEGMLRWEVAQWLAGGASGIGYFTYWTPQPDPSYYWGKAMIDWDGTRTPYYDMVSALNARVSRIGSVLAGLRHVATRFAGWLPRGGVAFTPDSVLAGVDGRATLGWFSDDNGWTYLFVANADSASARTLQLLSTDGRAPARLDDDGAWSEVARDRSGHVPIELEAGDFALLRFPMRLYERTDVGDRARTGPSLRVTPNPALGRARLDCDGLAAGGSMDLVDVSGRVVWTRALPPGATSVSWDGRLAAGGSAPRGIYFARLHGPTVTVVRRLAWLGAR